MPLVPRAGWTTSSVEPMPMVSPTASGTATPTGMSWSRRRVPFALPRSSICSAGQRCSRAWRREASASSIETSHSPERPITTDPEPGNGSDANASKDMTSTARPGPVPSFASIAGSVTVVFELIAVGRDLSPGGQNAASADGVAAPAQPVESATE